MDILLFYGKSQISVKWARVIGFNSSLGLKNVGTRMDGSVMVLSVLAIGLSCIKQRLKDIWSSKKTNLACIGLELTYCLTS